MLQYVLHIQDQKFKKLLRRSSERNISIKYSSMHISFLLAEFLTKMNVFSIVLLVSKQKNTKSIYKYVVVTLKTN